MNGALTTLAVLALSMAIARVLCHVTRYRPRVVTGVSLGYHATWHPAEGEDFEGELRCTSLDHICVDGDEVRTVSD